MKQASIKLTATIGAVLLTFSAHAGEANTGKAMGMDDMKPGTMNMNGSKSASMGVNEGEVKAVNKSGKKVTIKHGPLKSKTVEMGPMTMAFPVQDPALLSNVKVGDKVKFTVETVKDQATVTALEVQK